jgi:hypothetical protein
MITGDTAVELYTGHLWMAAELEILSGNMAALRDELVAQGFSWAAESRRDDPGLWHRRCGSALPSPTTVSLQQQRGPTSYPL